jgi:hypothetical protein
MWVQAGFSPNDFWHQTPAVFQLTMKGIRKRAEQEMQAATRQAWETGAFAAAGSAGKLKPLAHYLKTPSRAQTPKAMLAALMGYQAAGAKMTIRKIERK